ncbi:nucleotidyl transferase AbiEii/AbiGii toxin family protein [Streptococcus sp. NLN64]|uniref:nucleotidyl transferase AbiEii/AbiGii toxin family protein n=1 Tax=Streptococcus sp. NLN64 TaxID=2822799 RepID=UPI0018CA0A6C|nr:nucleotidyl transferase AbiEii/AbiGii toxin family protein [Streptococcus sp. NLN64]MBG9367309.1 nucleotidyl transferase AbiEii/AbiGii toxin family protein [Streptococcus sp. NLN64]
MNKNKLTALCHKLALEKQVSFNVALTYYFLESILTKIAKSEYSQNFVFKGGFLLSNMIGLESRSTSDMDFLLERAKLEEKVLVTFLNDILVDDAIQFQIGKIQSIRHQDLYGGFRISILCQFENIKLTIPLDIATGDPITPHKIEYPYRSLFTNLEIPIAAYNLESILAEKMETIYRRGFLNSRSKDFYDVYILSKLYSEKIDYLVLYHACQNTFHYRGIDFDLDSISAQLIDLKNWKPLKSYWENFRKLHNFVGDLSYEMTVESCLTIVNDLSKCQELYRGSEMSDRG